MDLLVVRDYFLFRNVHHQVSILLIRLSHDEVLDDVFELQQLFLLLVVLLECGFILNTERLILQSIVRYQDSSEAVEYIIDPILGQRTPFGHQAIVLLMIKYLAHLMVPSLVPSRPPNGEVFIDILVSERDVLELCFIDFLGFLPAGQLALLLYVGQLRELPGDALVGLGEHLLEVGD